MHLEAPFLISGGKELSILKVGKVKKKKKKKHMMFKI